MPAIEIDISTFVDFLTRIGQLPPHLLAWEIFKYLGWIPILVTVLWGIKEVHLLRQMIKYAKKQTYVTLAIDIPKDNEQTPKAFENILNQLAGAHTPVWWYDLYVEGEFQQGFSLEVASIEGNIQFLIKLNTKNRDLVEAAIYAQYPQAQLTEVNDYTEGMPQRFPDDTWDVWGTEFIPVKNYVYPIRGYQSFGDPLTEEYKDPMAGFLEILSRLSKGEQVWFQIIIIPIYQKWTSDGQKEIDKILNKAPKSKSGIIDSLSKAPVKAVEQVGDMFFGPGEGGSKPDVQESKEKKMIDLPPGEVNVIKAITEKCSKIGFKSKIRVAYIAKHEVFNKSKAAHAIVGAIKQFNTSDANSLKPDYKIIGTGGDYFFKSKKKKILNRRKSDLIYGFVGRDPSVGTTPFIMSVDEIASLYHFPINTVKTPLVQKVEAKTSAPPVNLPDEYVQLPVEEDDEPEIYEESEKQPFDFDNDYFEQQFAVNKDSIKKTAPTAPSAKNSTKIPKVPSNQEDMTSKVEPPSNLPV